MDDSQVTAAFRAQLAASIGTRRYETWFGPSTGLCFDDDCLTIRAASAFVRDWLKQNFAAALTTCSEAVLGRKLALVFEVDPEPSETDWQPAVSVEPASSSMASVAVATADRHTANRRIPAVPVTLKADHAPPERAPVETSLADFVVGACNEFAFRSAELTAHGRQQASPLLFCGPTGVGKTHLLRSIRSEYRRRYPRSRTVYLTAEQFTSSFVEALRGSGLPSFRQKCRGADLLAIDDLQFFAGKRVTLEELLHTIDTLSGEGRQLVLASDRPPGELRPFGQELISRLTGGLVCEIGPPEYATRLNIARRLATELRLAVDDDVLRLVAVQITASARELRGALHRLDLMSRAHNQPISRELAESALGELARQGARTVRLADVEHAVCEVFGVEPAQLRSDRKARSLSEPRMLAMWLARKYTRAPWSEIGEFFGRRSHSTVISAHRRVQRLIDSQAQIDVSNHPCHVEEAIRRLETAIRTA